MGKVTEPKDFCVVRIAKNWRFHNISANVDLGIQREEK